jgi:hypothetical protein
LEAVPNRDFWLANPASCRQHLFGTPIWRAHWDQPPKNQWIHTQ